jgi:hypothetical protein
MSQDKFDAIERAVQTGGAAAAFDCLIGTLQGDRQWPHLFEAMLMRSRWQLGLPLVQTEPLGDMPDSTRRAFEDGYIEAARTVGGLYLADGDIVRAWPYFRTIGETKPVAAALDAIADKSGDELQKIIEIAFYDRANPRKGFELILANYGTCSAITTFEQYPGSDGRQDCIQMLVRRLHGDLVESLRHHIAKQEGQAPETRSVAALVEGRDWLFGDNNYHVDTSHLAAVVRFSIELDDRESLALARELTEYGRRLAPLFQYKGSPPFENIYVDYGAYLDALLGENIDAAVAHFRVKAAGGDEAAVAAAQVLVTLLARLEHYDDAVAVALEFLRDLPAGQLACPTIPQLCTMAQDRDRLKALAREQDDLLSFTAAVVG